MWENLKLNLLLKLKLKLNPLTPFCFVLYSIDALSSPPLLRLGWYSLPIKFSTFLGQDGVFGSMAVTYVCYISIFWISLLCC